MISERTMFRVGEKVRLNSGSPDLTVIAINESSGKVQCEWHNGNSVDRLELSAKCFRPT